MGKPVRIRHGPATVKRTAVSHFANGLARKSGDLPGDGEAAFDVMGYLAASQKRCHHETPELRRPGSIISRVFLVFGRWIEGRRSALTGSEGPPRQIEGANRYGRKER